MVPVIIAAVSAAYSIGSSIHQQIQAGKEKKAAQKELENMERQTFSNAYSTLTAPTAGYNMQKESIMRSQAEAANAMSQYGARGVVGGSQRLMESTQSAVGDLSAKLAESKFRIDQLRASDEARIQGMQERREEMDIAGLGAQLNYGQQLQQSALNTGVSSMASMAELFTNMDSGMTEADKTAKLEGRLERKALRQAYNQ